jgi:hypothetical protein
MQRKERDGSDGGAIGALLAAVALALYVATLSRHHSADSLIYAEQIDAGDWALLVDPRHLLTHPLGLLWIRLWRLAGWSGSTIVPLQVLNAVAGAACVAMVYALAARVCASLPIAGLVAAAFAVSGGTWLLSTEAEFVTVPLAVELWVLGRVLIVPAHDLGRVATALAVGAVIGIATLNYMTSAALLPVALLRAWRHADGDGSYRALGALSAGFAATLAIAVLAVTLADPRGGALLLAGLGVGGYGTVLGENIPRGIYAICRTLVLYPGLGMNDRTTAFVASATAWQRAMFATTYLTVAVVVCAPLWLAMRRRLRFDDDWVIALWVALHAVFAFWWVPSDISFWMQVTVGWWLLVAVLIARRMLPAAALIAALPLLLLVNGIGFILPQHLPVP